MDSFYFFLIIFQISLNITLYRIARYSFCTYKTIFLLKETPNKMHLLYKVRILPRTPALKSAHHFKWTIPLFHMKIYPFLYKNEFFTTNFPYRFHIVFHFPLLTQIYDYMVKPYRNRFFTTVFPADFCTVLQFPLQYQISRPYGKTIQQWIFHYRISIWLPYRNPKCTT